MDKIDQIKQIISKDGNIISTRLNRKYFKKYDHEDLFDYVIENTLYAKNDISFRHRLLLIENGLSQPSCKICGKLHSRITTMNSSKDDKVSEYCSDTCRYNDPITTENKKNTWNNIDKNSANKKREETMLSKYGKAYNSQRMEIKELISKKTSKRCITNLNALDKIDDDEWIINEYVTNKKSASEIANDLGIFYGTVLDRIKKLGIKIRRNYQEPLPEKILVEYIKSIYSGEIITNTYDIINPKELDIYIPEFSFAIEHNGLYSHTYNNFVDSKYKFRHQEKSQLCKNKGIELLHIPGNYMVEKYDIIKSIISSKLYTNKIIYARKCNIVELSHKQERMFFDINHIQGYSSSTYCIGLEYDNEIVCAISFGKSRFDKNFEWELLRFSNKLFTNVVGGFSKLLKYSLKKYISTSLVTYCDFSISHGKCYTKNNFEQIESSSSLDYYWSDKRTLFSRYKFQKNKLEKLLPKFDPQLSEFENMFNNKYRIYYGCGQLKFKYKQ